MCCTQQEAMRSLWELESYPKGLSLAKAAGFTCWQQTRLCCGQDATILLSELWSD
jgi:hypothetical protein